MTFEELNQALNYLLTIFNDQQVLDVMANQDKDVNKYHLADHLDELKKRKKDILELFDNHALDKNYAKTVLEQIDKRLDDFLDALLEVNSDLEVIAAEDKELHEETDEGLIFPGLDSYTDGVFESSKHFDEYKKAVKDRIRKEVGPEEEIEEEKPVEPVQEEKKKEPVKEDLFKNPVMLEKYIEVIGNMSALEAYLFASLDEFDRYCSMSKPANNLPAGGQEKRNEIIASVKNSIPLKSNGTSIEDLNVCMEDYHLDEDQRAFFTNVYNTYSAEDIADVFIKYQENLLKTYEKKFNITQDKAIKVKKFVDSDWKNPQERENVSLELADDVLSAVIKHPAIKSLGIETGTVLDIAAKRTIDRVVEAILDGSDDSGIAIPYKEHVKAFLSSKAVREKLVKLRPEGIGYTPEELEPAPPEEKGFKITEELAKQYLTNPQKPSPEVPYDTSEENIEMYKGFLKVPGFKNIIFGDNHVLLNEVGLGEFYGLETELLNMINDEAAQDNSELSDESYDISSVRHFLRFAAARQNGLLKTLDEPGSYDEQRYQDGIKAAKHYAAELDKLVEKSDIFKEHLKNPVPDYNNGEKDSYLNVYNKNKNTYLKKYNESFDKMTVARRREFVKEANRIAKDHPYINGSDLFKYVSHKERDILSTYMMAIDPEFEDDSIPAVIAAAYTYSSIGESIASKAAKYELKNQKQAAPRKQENVVQKIEPNEPKVDVHQPEIKEPIIKKAKPVAKEEDPRELFQKELQVVNEAPKKQAIPAAQVRLGNNQVKPFVDEIVRLSDRLNKTHKRKQQNSESYDILRREMNHYASGSAIRSAVGLKMALTSLAVEAGEYMKDHAADNSGLFKTCGQARQERIRSCARIIAMKSLVDKGIAYDSKDGKKIMLACELVCAEKLNKGFDGFKELCQPNAIINAMKSKLGEPAFSKTADKLLENDADYEKLVKQSGSKCLKDFNKKASDLAKNNQVRER